MPDKPPVHQYVPLPTQFLQEEEPSDIEDEDELDAEYNQPLAQFRNSGTTRGQSASSMPAGRVLPASTFYGTSQRHLNTGQGFVHHGSMVDETISGRMQRGYRSLPTSGESSEDPYDYREVYNDPHQLIPSYHEYSITDVAGQSHSAESSGSFGMPDYFVSGTVSAAPSNSVGYGYGGLNRSNACSADQRDMAVYESQQKQEPKVISNENNRYTIVGHTVEGQPIYALQSVRTTNRPRLQQGSLYRVIDKGPQSRYVFLRQQQAVPTRRTRSESGDGKLSSENYRAVAREIVAKALEDKRIKQLSLQGSSTALPSSSGISGGVTTGKAKKKSVISDDENSEKLSGSTVVAQAGAIQRFSTPLGWKQMGSWLKAAEANADWNRLKLLLSQCAQANLTLELLQSNDTPKFVRKLSKTCPDQDVRKVSVDLVMRWKRLVAAPPRPPPEEVKKVGSAKRKTPHPPSASSSKAKLKKGNGEVPGANERGMNSEANKQREAVEDKSEFMKNPVNCENVEDSDTVFTKVEKSTKTAKVDGSKTEKADKTSEPKSDSSKAEKADKTSELKFDSNKAEKGGKTDEPKSDSSKTESVDKTTEPKSDSSKMQKAEKSIESDKPALSNKLNEFNMFEKLGEERKDKKQRPKTAKTYTSKFRSTGLEGDDEVATAKSNTDTAAALRKKTILSSKAVLDAKKRTAMSTGVSKVVTANVPNSVSSVSSSSKKQAPSAPARVMMSNTFMDALMDPGHKKTPAKQVKKRPVTNVKQSVSIIPSVMEGLYSDTIKLLSKEKQEEASTEQKKGSVVEEPDITSISNRKIRFADEHGQQLVEIRYFEVEEGERLNVSKLSSEDMKHLEMQRERTFMKEQRSLHITEFGFGSSRQEGSAHIPWKLIPLANAVCFEGRGSQSEAKKIEEERQKTIMMPFYDPSLPAEVADAEPELLTGAILPPTDIPLESEIEEDVNQDVAQGYKKVVAPWTIDDTLVEQNQGDGKEIDVQKLMSELKKKGLVGSSSDLASILNKVSSSTATSTSALSVSSVEQVNAITSDATYVALTTQSSISNIPLPSPRFAQGLPMPPVLSTGQYILPVQQQQPLLNGPVPAGVTPTVGVDLTTHSGPSTSEAPSYGTYGRLPVKQCTFYQAGTCSYGARCRFAHGEEPTAGTQGYGCGDERGRNLRRSGSTFRGGPRRGGIDVGYSFKRGRGGPPFGRRGYYDRERERDRDRDRDFDYDRRGCDRYERRRRRSWSRSRSRSHSRSRSRSESPFDRRQHSPDHRRRRGSPRGMHEYDREERLERRLKGEDRERGEQRAGDGGNQVLDLNQQYQPQPTEESCAAEGTDSSKVGSDLNTAQQKSPPEDPVPSAKLVNVVEAVNTNSLASLKGD